MKTLLRTFVLMLAAVTTLVLLAPDVEARRLGGGRSLGKSYGSIFKRAPTRQQAAKPAQGTPGKAAGNRGGLMGPLTGLAAGLGLVALASYLGFGEELANIMMIVLMVGAGFLLFRLLTGGARRTPAGATAGAGSAPLSGNNANHQRSAWQADATAPSAAGAMLSPSGDDMRPADVPADFDVDAFLHQAKVQFIRLQAVYDAGDLNDLRQFTSPEMFAELQLEVKERGTQANKTDVVALQADLLGVTTQGAEHVAAVHFTGSIREQSDAAANPLSEIWMLTKPVDGSSGWVLAGVEQADEL